MNIDIKRLPLRVLRALRRLRGPRVDIEQIEQLMRALKENDFHEVEIAQGSRRITLRRAAGGPMTHGAAFPMNTGERERARGLDDAPESAPVEDASLVTVTSPLVGTFYRSPSPQARSFVEVGSLVRQGTVLCIVEAMKLMNEIESEVDGVVTEVLVENGKPVEFGQGLLRIRRAG